MNVFTDNATFYLMTTTRLEFEGSVYYVPEHTFELIDTFPIDLDNVALIQDGVITMVSIPPVPNTKLP